MNQSQVPLTIDFSAKRIVVINTAFLGDLILSIPFLSLLKKKYPKSYITLVCKKGIGDFFIKLHLIDQAIEVQKGTADDYARAAAVLNRDSQDLLFCIHRSFRSFLFSLKIKATIRLGYKLGYNFFGYQKKVKRDLELPEPLRVIQLLTLMDQSFAGFFSQETSTLDYNTKDDNGHMIAVPGWAKFPQLNTHVKNQGKSSTLQAIMAAMPASGKRIAVFPGSVWNTKRWPVESFAGLIDQLSGRHHTIVLMGGPGEEIYGQQIEKIIKAETKMVNIIGRSSVWESATILEQCDLVIANDSASAHIGALLGKKILSFFGPTVLSFGYRPWSDAVYILENTQLDCRPCGAHGPKECPIKTHICMTSISPESAFKKSLSILS
jgi:heptosyltransferase-2